jgi:DNA helicase-2/ATP-dependent DNA helicase PcrA
MKTFTPSPQQEVFFSWIQNESGSAVLRAVAGAGKTTTLIKALEMMPGKIFFGAYNKKIADEISSKATAKDGLEISTMHSAGFKFLRKAFKNTKVNGDKCRDIFRNASSKFPEYKPFESSVLKLVSLAKQTGLGILKDMNNKQEWLDIIQHFDIEVFSGSDDDCGNLISSLAKKTLERSIQMDPEVIDFDDMIFSPLYHNVKITGYDWVLIDEAQDTNGTRRALALKMLKKNGRLVAVGDERQAIYSFQGADSNSLDLISDAVNAVSIPLTTTFRCPKAVVKYAQNWVSHIQAADTAPEGIVRSADIKNLTSLAKPGDAILCRFNAPLIENVYRFIAEGIPAKVEGREIGNGLKVLARRYKAKTFAALTEKLNAYLEREIAKFIAAEQESKVTSLKDKMECLNVIIGRAYQKNPNSTDPVQLICDEVDSIFTENGSDKVVLFSSVHKSKGREWMTVIWLQTGPSPYAKQDWELLAEDNLCYVAASRSMNELILVDVPKKKKAE